MGFGGINVALSALYAQRQALETTGHNIANANTEGYTRQRVSLAANAGPITPAMFETYSGAGAGVRVDSIERLNDHFLQLRSLQEHAADSGLQQTKTILTRAELAFAEPGDNGIQAQLADFWSAWDDVANTPDDLATRTQLLEKAQTVTAGFRQASSDLKSLQVSSVSQVADDVAQINSMAQSIAQLNAGIDTAVNGGLNSADLEDQRDKLIQQLNQLTGVTIRDGRNKTVDVFINGNAIVRGRDATAVHLDTTGSTAVLKWDLDNSGVNITTGKVSALLNAANNTLPGYLAKLDTIAQTFMTTVNTQHAAGVDLNSSPSATPSGQNLLNGTGAADIDVDATVTPDKVAAAAVNGGRLDGSNALVLAEMGSMPTGADAAYRSFIDSLGVDVMRAGTQSDIQAEITRQADTASQSASGVNLDEEMANMVAFQHAYDAAARFMTAIDQQLDTLIHNTGLVGR